MALTKTEVEKIAHLARLHVTDTEAEEVAKGVSDILGLIDKMQSIDTDNVEPLAHPFDAVQSSGPTLLPRPTAATNCRSSPLRVKTASFWCPK